MRILLSLICVNYCAGLDSMSASVAAITCSEKMVSLSESTYSQHAMARQSRIKSSRSAVSYYGTA